MDGCLTLAAKTLADSMSSGVTTSAFIEETRKKLAKEVEEHFRAIAELRRRMNAIIPVARLPPEILGHIFLWYITVMATHRDPGYYRDSYHRWLTVTHVCHRWREIGLCTPNLWTDIRIGQGSVERVQAFISRAKHAPLQIHASNDCADIKWLPALHLIASELGHVETLNLNVPLGTLKTLTDNIPSSAPLLRLLTIAGSSYYGSTPLTLPVFLTSACSTPRLEELKVVGYNLSWLDSILPQSLTHLAVTLAGSSQETQCSDVVTVIHALSCLKHLELNRVLAPLQTTITRLPPISLSVSLPNLTCIILLGSPLVCVHFLDHCVIPASARISLNFQSSCTPHVIPLIMPAISTKLSTRIIQDDKEPVETLSIRCGSVAFVKRSLGPIQNRTHAHLSILAPGYLVEDGSMLAGLCGLPIRDVSVLLLREVSYNPSARPAWLALFQVVVKIAALSISSEPPYPSDIIAMLRTRLEGGEAQKGKLIMPNLRHLLLQEVRFRDINDDENDSFVADLCAAFKARRKGRRKLEKLSIKKCVNMNQDDVTKLQKVVDVIWDGEVEYDEEDEDEDEDEYREFMEEDDSSDPLEDVYYRRRNYF
ncbi:hypothetical protein EUX98_g6491 [Antrodiella citrinella]|uniref:F-box domain-containing protein n=1 Tax=Antrodiella citrinella TaxID=2447956 RepID=A0A4S4MNU7_9APHY|nr:hypothetical protein EUX98_g6491 [Antrodiella citrinella]